MLCVQQTHQAYFKVAEPNDRELFVQLNSMTLGHFDSNQAFHPKWPWFAHNIKLRQHMETGKHNLHSAYYLEVFI